MSNSGDLLLTEIFYLLFPGIAILIAVVLVTYFYIQRIRRVLIRYKIQKLEEVENERKRIANDLHDFVASKLIKIKSELNDSLQNAKDPVVYKHISQGIFDLNKFHGDLRYLVEYIYPKELLSGNIQQSILKLTEEMSNANTQIILDIEFEHQLPKEKMHQLFRLLQEKITNILVHNKPPKVFIGLFEDVEEHQVMLSMSYQIKNNSFTIDSMLKNNSGRGLPIIKERLKVLKAKTQNEFKDGFFKETIIFPIK